MVDPARIIEALNRAEVDFVVIGGVAATLHGCPEQTYDLDVLYAGTVENRARLLRALQDIEAQWDVPLTDAVLQRQPVFALNTRHGDLDIFTDVPGMEGYSAVSAAAVTCILNGVPVRVLNLADLILTKEAANDSNPRKRAALGYLKDLLRAQRGN